MNVVSLQLYSTVGAAAAAGVDPRTLGNWAYIGLITPSAASGRRVLYSREAIEKIMAIKASRSKHARRQGNA